MKKISKALRAFATGFEILADELDEGGLLKKEEPKAAAPVQAEDLEQKPRGRGRPPKKKVEEEQFEMAMDSSEDWAEDDFAATPEEPEEKEVTADDLKKSLVEFASKHGKEKAFAILGKHGAKKVADLPPAKIGKVYSEIQAGL